jgi:hypothetical protein
MVILKEIIARKGFRIDKKTRHIGLKTEMNRKDINYNIDMAMLLSFILCGITGIIKWPGLIHFFGTELSKYEHWGYDSNS